MGENLTTDVKSVVRELSILDGYVLYPFMKLWSILFKLLMNVKMF